MRFYFLSGGLQRRRRRVGKRVPDLKGPVLRDCEGDQRCEGERNASDRNGGNGGVSEAGGGEFASGRGENRGQWCDAQRYGDLSSCGTGARSGRLIFWGHAFQNGGSDGSKYKPHANSGKNK